MQTYPSYRDSGVKWLGNIPQNWKVKKIKYISNIYTGNSISDEKKDQYESEIDAYPYISTKDISLDNNQADYENGMYTPIEDLSFRVARKDNTLICIEGGSAGKKMTYLLQDVTFVNKLCCIQTYNFVSKFAFYYLQTKSFEDEFKLNLSGLIGGVNQSELKNFYILAPSIQEQEIIAGYLDVRTEQIDTLISKLQIQAEMLETYKRELIAEVVTKGLNKEASLKDSGVDWIGNVPKHWAVTKIKWMFEIVKRIYGKEDRDVLSITQQGIKIKDVESNKGQLAESYANYQVVNINDFAMNSMDLLTGWVDCSPYEGVTSPDYRVFRFLGNKPQCHRYYKYIFQMCYKNRIFYRIGQGVSNLGRWRLQTDQFLNMYLPQPPIIEQKKIADFLDEKTGKIDEVVSDITQQIKKLKDYRRILIHEAVTGKIKITEG